MTRFYPEQRNEPCTRCMKLSVLLLYCSNYQAFSSVSHDAPSPPSIRMNDLEKM